MEELYAKHAPDDGDDADDDVDDADDDVDDADDDESWTSREERAVARAHRGHRTHSRSVFDPPPSNFEKFREKMWKYFDVLCIFWKRVRNDPYQWSLFKSIFWFIVGLKLFSDMARHAKVSALFGGVPPPAPPRKPCPPKIIICHSKSDRRSTCLKSVKVRHPPVCSPVPTCSSIAPAEELDKECEDAFQCCG